jgi:putative addiction module component (TIGR02574 family)
MTETLEHMKSRIGELSGSDRAELAYYLLSTLEPVEADVEEAWQGEITRRLEEVRQGSAKGRPVDEVLAELRTRHP